MSTRIGQMRRRVSVQVLTRVAGTGGGYTETATSVATVWARVEPLEGDEQIQAMQTGMKRPHRFTMRYRSDISGVTTLLYGARQFDVRSVVDHEERHRELQVLAEELV